jgi:hypothetical protein
VTDKRPGVEQTARRGAAHRLRRPALLLIGGAVVVPLAVVTR